jgi:hypothetical protein
MGARKLGFLGPSDAMDLVEIGNGMYFHVCSDYRSRIFNWSGNYSGIGCVSRKSHVQCVRGHKIDELGVGSVIRTSIPNLPKGGCGQFP